VPISPQVLGEYGRLAHHARARHHAAGACGRARAPAQGRGGGGYPDGLAGEQIPLAARIIAACDTYQAIVTDRPYRRARALTEAVAELRRVAGAQLDARVVEALLEELKGR
jgi:hypothetical protein